MCAKLGYFKSNPILRDRELTDGIAVSVRVIPRGPPNKAFSKINPRLMQYYSGSYVVHGETVITEGERHSIYDLAASELPHFVDNLSVQADNSRRSSLKRLTRDDRQYTGVLSNCVGDQHFLGWPAQETLTCVLNSTVSDIIPEAGSEEEPVMKKLELPLLFCKVPQSLSWKNRPEPILLPTFNPIRAWLTKPDMTSTYMPKTDAPRDRAFPTKFIYNLYNTGTTFICRADEKPFLPTHMAAISIYLRTRVEAWQKTDEGLAAALDVMSLGEGKEYEPGAWLNKISKDDFRKWYSENLDKLESMEAGAKDLPGPYDLQSAKKRQGSSKEAQGVSVAEQLDRLYIPGLAIV
ncbi:hypothetical protein N0V87_010355 [Didymella glomerata]|uniref:Uncharacterized protein n=1 Tax=Didymella glomerata TaxID=749621 RepID=A0A9W8WPJ5_9PLEO|nr:hypothetical protein N0V87_010355 [Didymella glomerata]